MMVANTPEIVNTPSYGSYNKTNIGMKQTLFLLSIYPLKHKIHKICCSRIFV